MERMTMQSKLLDILELIPTDQEIIMFMHHSVLSHWKPFSKLLNSDHLICLTSLHSLDSQKELLLHTVLQV